MKGKYLVVIMCLVLCMVGCSKKEEVDASTGKTEVKEEEIVTDNSKIEGVTEEVAVPENTWYSFSSRLVGLIGDISSEDIGVISTEGDGMGNISYLVEGIRIEDFEEFVFNRVEERALEKIQDYNNNIVELEISESFTMVKFGVLSMELTDVDTFAKDYILGCAEDFVSNVGLDVEGIIIEFVQVGGSV